MFALLVAVGKLRNQGLTNTFSLPKNTSDKLLQSVILQKICFNKPLSAVTLLKWTSLLCVLKTFQYRLSFISQPVLRLLSRVCKCGRNQTHGTIYTHEQGRTGGSILSRQPTFAVSYSAVTTVGNQKYAHVGSHFWASSISFTFCHAKKKLKVTNFSLMNIGWLVFNNAKKQNLIWLKPKL